MDKMDQKYSTVEKIINVAKHGENKELDILIQDFTNKALATIKPLPMTVPTAPINPIEFYTFDKQYFTASGTKVSINTSEKLYVSANREMEIITNYDLEEADCAWHIGNYINYFVCEAAVGEFLVLVQVDVNSKKHDVSYLFDMHPECFYSNLHSDRNTKYHYFVGRGDNAKHCFKFDEEIKKLKIHSGVIYGVTENYYYILSNNTEDDKVIKKNPYLSEVNHIDWFRLKYIGTIY